MTEQQWRDALEKGGNLRPVPAHREQEALAALRFQRKVEDGTATEGRR